jgi:peptidoglycan/xylan/chitin deacetylase (PgdA/CDA1 family)
VPAARGLYFVAWASALVVSCVKLIHGPASATLLIAVLGGYLVALGCGVAVLRFQVFVNVVWRGPRGASGVALTFDDGPSPDYTSRVLELLDEEGVLATFFLIGTKAEKFPELVRAIADRGHGIGIHSYSHDRFLALRSPKTVADDLARAIGIIETIVGARPTCFRPPVGLSSPRIALAISRLGLTVVGWSVRGFDGCRGARPTVVAERVRRGLRDGAIVLLHDAAEKDDYRPASVDALPEILRAMRSRALRGVRLEAWLESGPATAGVNRNALR